MTKQEAIQAKPLTAADLVVGERYVPINKTDGFGSSKGLENSRAWNEGGKQQGFLYYNGFSEGRYMFSATERLGGDFFRPSDVIPYVEPETTATPSPVSNKEGGEVPANITLLVTGVGKRTDEDEYPALMEENKQLRKQVETLRGALVYVQSVIEKAEAWWMDNPDKGGFDTEKITAALSQTEPK